MVWNHSYLVGRGHERKVGLPVHYSVPYFCVVCDYYCVSSPITSPPCFLSCVQSHVQKISPPAGLGPGHSVWVLWVIPLSCHQSEEGQHWPIVEGFLGEGGVSCLKHTEGTVFFLTLNFIDLWWLVHWVLSPHTQEIFAELIPLVASLSLYFLSHRAIKPFLLEWPGRGVVT